MGLLYELATEIEVKPPINDKDAEEISKAVDQKIKEYYNKEENK